MRTHVVHAAIVALTLAGCPAPASRAVDDGTPIGDGTVPADAAPLPDMLGGTVTETGATFRVWAPNADAVAVTGDFDDWSMTAHPLAKQQTTQWGTIWTGDVAGARAGQHYRYALSQGGKTYTQSDPRARALDDASGASVLVDPTTYRWTASFTPPPPSHQVIYELHLGTFNVRPGEPRGTYASAIDRLDTLAALGINMIEVLPVSEYPGPRSWGYNPAGPFAVESSLGTPDDFRALVDAAHARGIGVIVDVVHNHYDAGPLLRCWDGPCNGALGIYFYTGGFASTPWGPRPDYGRPEVRAYIEDNALMWLREYHCDGMRWDATRYMAEGIADGWRLLREANDAVHALAPGAIEIAEDWRTDANLSRPTAAGGGGFDSQWDGFVHDINGAILAGGDGARSMASVRGAIERRYNGRASERVIFTESHDEVANGRRRIPEMIAPGNANSKIARQLSTLGAAVAFTSPGIPMLFMGQEMLQYGYFNDDRPLDWKLAATYPGIVQLYTDLVHLRRNTAGTTAGLTGDGVSVFHVNDGAKVIAWRRWSSPGDDVVVIANFSGTRFPVYDLGLPAAGTWRVRFHSSAALYSPDFDNSPTPDVVAAAVPRHGLPFQGSVVLDAYSVVILSR